VPALCAVASARARRLRAPRHPGRPAPPHHHAGPDPQASEDRVAEHEGSVPCVCHAPLPPLPRRLRAIEIAYGRRWRWDQSYRDAEPLLPGDLSVDARGRLLERAELRAGRVVMSERHAAEDWCWIASELALVLPTSSPKIAERWAPVVRRAIESAQRTVDRLCRLEALILRYEPTTEAWLRRQLGALAEASRPEEPGR